MTQILNQFNQSPEQGQKGYGYTPNSLTAMVAINSSLSAQITGGVAMKLVGVADQGRVIVDVAGATDPVFGFVLTQTNKNTYSPGSTLELALRDSIMYMTAGEDLSANDSVQINATDKTVEAADGTGDVVGIVLQDVLEDDLALVFINTPNIIEPGVPVAGSKFIGLNSVLNYSAGTWTRTRIAAGNYAQVKTAADDTTIIGIDITEAIRLAAGKGLELQKIRVIFSNATVALDAHTAALSKVSYADVTAVLVTSVPLTGSLATGVNANPQISELTITTPAYDNTANSKYVFELTVNAAATSAYAFYGLMLDFIRS